MNAAAEMQVSQWMNRDVRICAPEDTLAEAAAIMREHDCGFVPALAIGPDDVHRVAGVITDRDVCMAAFERGSAPSSIRVGDVMSRAVRACRPNETLHAAAALMRRHRVRRLPVVDADGVLVGILSITDLARWAEHERTTRSSGAAVQELTATLAALCAPRRHPPSANATGAIAPAADFELARRQRSDEEC